MFWKPLNVYYSYGEYHYAARLQHCDVSWLYKLTEQNERRWLAVTTFYFNRRFLSDVIFATLMQCNALFLTKNAQILRFVTICNTQVIRPSFSNVTVPFA